MRKNKRLIECPKCKIKTFHRKGKEYWICTYCGNETIKVKRTWISTHQDYTKLNPRDIK